MPDLCVYFFALPAAPAVPGAMWFWESKSDRDDMFVFGLRWLSRGAAKRGWSVVVACGDGSSHLRLRRFRKKKMVIVDNNSYGKYK